MAAALECMIVKGDQMTCIGGLLKEHKFHLSVQMMGGGGGLRTQAPIPLEFGRDGKSSMVIG